MRGSPRVLPSSEPSANLPNTESLMEPKQRPHAGPHLLLQVPVLSASPGLTGSPQPVTRQSSHPRQLCPDAAMAPWALLCPLGPCRCPPEVWVRTQLQRGAQGHPTHLPGGTSPPVLQMGKQAQRSRVTHPRSHTGKWYKQETHPPLFCSVASDKHLWSACCASGMGDTHEHGPYLHPLPDRGTLRKEEAHSTCRVLGRQLAFTQHARRAPKVSCADSPPRPLVGGTAQPTLVQHLFGNVDGLG